MPVRAPRICSCGKLVPSGARCPCQVARKRETNRQHDRERGNSSQRGYDGTWERKAKTYLARRENRRCAVCGAPATVVMHIHSIRARPDLRMDPTNWQPGCRKCNAIDAARERRTRKDEP